MADPLKPDLCILGAGPGGIALAMAASALGASVVVVEPADARLDRSAIVTALSAAGRHAEAVRQGERLGVEAIDPAIDFKAVLAHAGRAAADLAPNADPRRLTALGVTVLRAKPRFADARTVEAGEVRIRARRFVVATGSLSPPLPYPALLGCETLTADTLLSLARRPAHLAVLGASAEGLQLAQAFRRLGSEVTVIEPGEPLPGDDPELAEIVLRRLRAEGVAIRDGVSVTAIEKRPRAGVRFVLDGLRAVDASHVLVATARAPNVGGLALDAAGVATGPNGIAVSPKLQSANGRVFALGEAAGFPPGAHVERHQAALLVGALLFRRAAPHDATVVPRLLGTDPDIAVLGLNEAQARAGKAGKDVRVFRVPFADNARARADGRPEGHLKLVAGPTGTILGVGIVGAGAAEAIAPFALAIAQRMDLATFARHAAAHPSFGEIGKIAAMTYLAEQARSRPVRRLTRLLRLFG